MSLFPLTISKRKINVSAIKAEVKAVQKKHFHASCPITRGCPTTMAENIFRKVCGLHQAKETLSYCNQVCHGEKLPDGLTFADKSTIEDTMTSYVTGKCEICGQQKNIKKCLDKMTCSSCDFVYRSIKNNPERVLEKLVETKGKSWLALTLGFDEGRPVKSAALDTANKKIELLEQAVAALQDNLAAADVLAVGYREDLEEKDREIKYLQESLETAMDLPVPGYIPVMRDAVTVSRESAVLDLAIDILAGKIQGVAVERLQALR